MLALERFVWIADSQKELLLQIASLAERLTMVLVISLFVHVKAEIYETES